MEIVVSQFCTPSELRTITGTADREKQLKFLSREYGIHAAFNGGRVIVYRDVVKAAQLRRSGHTDGVEMNLEALNG